MARPQLDVGPALAFSRVSILHDRHESSLSLTAVRSLRSLASARVPDKPAGPWARARPAAEKDQASPSPRPAFAVWLFQRALPATEGEVGKRGTGPSLSILSYVARSPVPRRHRLPSTVPAGHPMVFSHGQHTASRFEGRTWGFITQPRYRCATDPAPPPSLIPGAHQVPARAMRQVSLTRKQCG